MSLKAINQAVSSSLETSTRGAEFITLARCLALAKGDPLQASRLAEARGAANVADILDKAATSAGGTTDPAWAGALVPYDRVSTAFLDSLRYSGAFDRLLPDMMRIPLHSRTTVVSSGATGATVGEMQVKPISKLSLSSGVLDPLKAVGIVVLTDETLRLAGPEGSALLGRELRAAVAVATDIQFIAVISAGVAPTAQSGITPVAVAADIGTALAGMQLSAASRIYMLTSGSFAAQLSVMMGTAGGLSFPGMAPSGGSIGAITVVPTDAVGNSDFLLVDASQIAAASTVVTLDSSKEADLQMDSVPDSPPVAGTSVVSLWQQNMTGIKAERYFGCERLRATAVAIIQ